MLTSRLAYRCLYSSRGVATDKKQRILARSILLLSCTRRDLFAGCASISDRSNSNNDDTNPQSNRRRAVSGRRHCEQSSEGTSCIDCIYQHLSARHVALKMRDKKRCESGVDAVTEDVRRKIAKGLMVRDIGWVEQEDLQGHDEYGCEGGGLSDQRGHCHLRSTPHASLPP